VRKILVTSKKRNKHLARFEKIAVAVAFLLAMFPVSSYAEGNNSADPAMNQFAKVVRANQDETPAEAASQPGNQNSSEIQKAKESQEQEDDRPVLKPMSELYSMDQYSTEMPLPADREAQESADVAGHQEENNKKNNFEKLLNAVDEEAQTEEMAALVENVGNGNMDSETDGADDKMGGEKFADLSRIEADDMAELQPTHVPLAMAGSHFRVDYASPEDDLMAAALNDFAKKVADEQENRKIEKKKELTQEEQEPMSVLRESGLSQLNPNEEEIAAGSDEERPDTGFFSVSEPFSVSTPIELGKQIAEQIGKVIFTQNQGTVNIESRPQPSLPAEEKSIQTIEPAIKAEEVLSTMTLAPQVQTAEENGSLSGVIANNDESSRDLRDNLFVEEKPLISNVHDVGLENVPDEIVTVVPPKEEDRPKEEEVSAPAETSEESTALVGNVGNGNMDSETDGADDKMGGEKFADLSRIEADDMAELQPTHVPLAMAGSHFRVDYASPEDDLMAAALNDFAKKVADEQENRKIEKKKELTQEEQEPMSVLRESGLSQLNPNEEEIAAGSDEERPDTGFFSVSEPFSVSTPIELGKQIAEQIGKVIFTQNQGTVNIESRPQPSLPAEEKSIQTIEPAIKAEEVLSTMTLAPQVQTAEENGSLSGVIANNDESSRDLRDNLFVEEKPLISNVHDVGLENVPDEIVTVVPPKEEDRPKEEEVSAPAETSEESTALVNGLNGTNLKGINGLNGVNVNVEEEMSSPTVTADPEKVAKNMELLTPIPVAENSEPVKGAISERATVNQGTESEKLMALANANPEKFPEDKELLAPTSQEELQLKLDAAAKFPVTEHMKHSEMVEVMTTKLVSNPEEMAGAMGLLTPAPQNEQKNIGELIKPETAAPGESDKSEAPKAFPALAFEMATQPVKNQLTSPPPAGVFQSIARALEPIFATVTSIAPNLMSATSSASPRSSYDFASTSNSDTDFFENNKFKFASYTLPFVSYSRVRGVYHSNASYDRRKKRRFQSSF